MQKTCVVPLAWVLGWLLFSGCDTEKFFGYNYDADQIAELVNISGRVSNTFTGAGVKEALVSIGGQSALTDTAGNYLLVYLLGSDEEFNRPIPVTVTAPKYHVLNTSLVIFPIENIFNARLIYGAPIIEDSYRLPEDTLQNGVRVQAVIFDYQGISDILTVFAYGYYRDPGLKITFEDSTEMRLIQVIDNNTGLYDGLLLNSSNLGGMNGYLLSSRHKIVARDKSGFFEKNFYYY